MKATIKCNGQEKEVELTDEELREFGFKESKVWKPKHEQIYYYINEWLNIEIGKFYCNDDLDSYRYDFGNCYKTQEQAEFERDCQLYLTKYKRWLQEHNEPIDWKDDYQHKYYAYYDTQSKEIVIDCECTAIIQGTLYATSEQIIEDFIAEIGEENFKKYILRVKED